MNKISPQNINKNKICKIKIIYLMLMHFVYNDIFSVIYGTCSCGAKYIGETDRCIHLRTNEHENEKKASEPAKHLKANRGHSFMWKVIACAPSHDNKRKILEALFVSKFKPGLNEQVMSKRLKLFPNGLT